MKKIIQLLAIFIITLNLQALDINETSSNIAILSNSLIYIDKTNSFSKNEILKQNFTPNTQTSLGLGIVPNTALWIKFTLKNTTDKELTKILEYANPETEDLYFYDENNTILDGMFHHSQSRFSLNPIFKIQLKAYEEKTYLIKAHCKISTLIAKLTLWNETDFLHYDYKHTIFIFIFFAVIITLLFYNLMLFVFTKDMAYFYYIIYLTAMLFFEAVYLGFAQLYFFTNAMSIFVTKGTIGYISMLLVPIILFTMEFLHTKKNFKIHFILKAYLYLLPVVTILSFDNFFFDLNIMVIFFPLAFTLIFTALHAYSNGVKEAQYYLLGWSALIISLNISVYESMGGDLVFGDFAYANEIAFMFEAFMFSIALAHRIKIISQAKTNADKKLIKFQQEEQNRLKILVASKTKDLQSSVDEKEILYKELNHRVKNNLGMILSLIKLQINQSNIENTREELTRTKDRINSISKLYELLHIKEGDGDFSTQTYFGNIIRSIEENFHAQIKIECDIQYNINLNNSVYCGLILNELVTNSLKYAFKNSGIIKISTSILKGEVTMVIEDNGIGFNEREGSSLGLTIVNTLAQKQLHGHVNIRSKDGTKTTITWKE